MSNRILFWRQIRGQWPIDGLGKVFLGRALLKLGSAMFSEQWTGKEPTVERKSHLPGSFSAASSAHKVAAWEYLGIPVVRGPFGLRGPDLSTEQWTKAVEARHAEIAEVVPLERRWRAVLALTAEAFRSGQLRAYLRPLRGGKFSAPVPIEWWNTEHLGDRFFCCQMNPAKPFDVGIAGDGYCWIYVDQAELENVLRTIASVHSPEIQALNNKPCHFPSLDNGKMGEPRLDRHAKRRKRRPSPQMTAIHSAVQALWGGKEPDLLEVERNHRIQAWLRENARNGLIKHVSTKTIQRYFKHLRENGPAEE